MILEKQALTELVRPIVEQSLAARGLDRTEIRIRTDHDGDPIIEIAAYFASRAKRVPSEITFELNQKILNALREKRDDHFPLLLMLYEEDLPPERIHARSRKRAL